MNEDKLKFWIEEVIIGLNLCPFAKVPYENKLIETSFTNVSDEQDMLNFFLDELDKIQAVSSREISNALICFPNFSKGYEAFYDFVSYCEDILEELELEDSFQLVCFHPDFQFENTKKKDLVNLINSSPFPIIHILRSQEVTFATKNYQDAQAISIYNEQKLLKMPPSELKRLFPWWF